MEGDGVEEVEGQRPKVLRSPLTPTAEEIEEHEALGHTIHRTWCGHCMRSRGMVEQHREVEHRDDAIPTLHMDYFFFNEKDEDNREHGLPHLQVKDSFSKMSWASPVPAKGVDPFAVNFVIGILEEIGYPKLILRSDNEPSIKALKSAVKEASKLNIILEESKTGDSPSNGAVEVAVRETKRQCRCMKSSLEEQLGKEVGEKHPILSWLARHANFLMSRYRIGPDGRTGHERARGKKWRRPVVAFGERIWFRPLKSYMKGQSDLESRLLTGRYVGTHGRNGDVLVMTSDGVLKGGSVKRMPSQERWDPSDLDGLRGTPWNLRPKLAEDVDSLPVRIDLPAAEGRLTPEPAQRDGAPRNLYVTKKDVEGHYTAGCPGCIAIQVGLPARSHNSECRTAVEQRLNETELGRARVERAQKRKAGDSKEGNLEERASLEDVPDQGEEMHGPDAVGNPAMERVDPVGLPSPGGEDRADPLGQSSQRKRTTEDPEGSRKRSKTPPPAQTQGVKRPVDPLEDRTTFAELMEDIRQEEKRAKGSSAAPSSGSKKSGNSTVKDVATILQERIFRQAPTEDILEIGQLLMSMGSSRKHVAEIYNPERFTSKANRFGLEPGFAIDLTLQKNSKGDYWDLSKQEDKVALKGLLQKERPLFLIGSPPCGPFSPLQNLNKYKRTPEQNEEILEEGRDHLRTAVGAYTEQHRNGRFFLHEHPRPSSSWEEPEVQKLMAMEGVIVVESPMCKWHMMSEDNQGAGFVKKETRWVTNSPEVAKIIEGKCSGSHRHVHLVNGRARHAQVYPPKLVSAILKGIRNELRKAGELNELKEATSGPSPDGISNDPTEELQPIFEEVNEHGGPYYDSVTGMPLDPAKVQAARKEEMKWVLKQDLYEVVDEKVCWDETNRPPISLKWVDRNKGDEMRENYRSRLVVREIKKASKPLAEFESFSAMPPLEALKALCSLMVSRKRSKFGKLYKLKLLDISRAHFYGVSRRRVFCTLPEGEEIPNKCALLKRSMYGTMDAASIWQETYTDLLKEHDIKPGVAWPSIFYHEASDSRILCHGDDFVVLSDDDGQKFIESVLAKKFEYRIDGCVGPEAQDGTAMTVLNRIIEYDKKSGTIYYEADPRHAEAVVKQLKLENAKEVTTPGEKVSQDEAFRAMELPPLPAEQASQYRSLVMRCAYLSQDRVDLCESVKSLARFMSAPTEHSWSRLKRLGRYLKGHLRVVQEFRPQTWDGTITCYTDSDHAGCTFTRKSTSGVICMAGSHCLKGSSTVQSTIALSSGESEYYSIVKASATVLGMRAMYSDWGIETKCVVKSDSSAARGICNRRGLGKTRHVQTRFLWVQHQVAEKEIQLEKVSTDSNLSDICTKPVSKDLCLKHMTTLGQFVKTGKSLLAKQGT